MRQNRLFHLSLLIVLIFLSINVIQTSCTKAQSDSDASQEDLQSRYIDMVHREFKAKARQHGADERYLIIVDYSIPSNQDRLFIWDAENNEIVERFWCAHGFGGGSTAERPVFSNTLGSNCSSLGWFLVDREVGVSAHWGYSYHAVEGLHTCNSNARRRQILIHPWGSVDSDYEAQIDRPMNLDGRSAGCFTTTHEGFRQIDTYTKSCQKQILLFAADGI